MKERIEENTGIFDLAIGTSFHKSYNSGRTFGRTCDAEHRRTFKMARKANGNRKGIGNGSKAHGNRR